jgi:lipopolysaccharide transport system ATP-binding protein
MESIVFENISKQYRLGLVSTGTIAHDLNRWWTMNILRREDPYLKIGETNDRSKKGSSEYVWALKDINFKVEQGDVVGIIGKNGAGKSTLLKLLSRVTAPTTGCIKARGRIASLLEVGTGFHPEMTGRENIYMNGAIMGMTKQEIGRKLDEIIDFSGCERYIDTPVKRYSSGMTVRLGFAIAAHLEPEILVVDEVLAVCDAEFQKKAIGKMKDVSQGGGRTVLFVSHNMAAVKSLCKKGVLLENGMVKETGDVDTVVGHYLKGNNNIANHKIWKIPEVKCEGIEILEIGVRAVNASFESLMRIDNSIELYLKYRITKTFERIVPAYYIKNEQGQVLFVISASSATSSYSAEHNEGFYENICKFPANFFNWGTFYIDLLLSTGQKVLLKENDIVSFTLANIETPLGQWMGRQPGDLLPKIIEYNDRKII